MVEVGSGNGAPLFGMCRMNVLYESVYEGAQGIDQGVSTVAQWEAFFDAPPRRD